MKLKLTAEQKDVLSYDDVAYLILQETNTKTKIQELFKTVIELLELPESVYENNIGEFFELIVTDKRFIMLDGGFIDLKINHSSKVIMEDDDEEELDVTLDDQDELEDEEEDSIDNYDEDSNPDDDTDNDLKDLVIIDETDQLEASDML